MLLLSFSLSAQVVINEFSSSNATVIADEDGEYSDWIELYNPSSLPVNLDGYHLSDDTGYLKKWTFPALILKPSSYLLVFASDKNRTEVPISYQTIIDRGTEWKYLIPSSEIGSSWTTPGYDDSAWTAGNSGFGYGDNDDLTVLVSGTRSVFIRKKFVISNLQDISEVVLSIDYDDGFAAYINGYEIARSNLGAAGSAIAYNKVASASREATMYSGGLPQTYRISNPASILVEGINVIAVQGHNNSSTSTDLSLIPMLSIGLKGAGYIDQLPSYVQLTGNKLHTNFKIAGEGETLILSRPDTSRADSALPVLLNTDISYGRKPDGNQTWFYFPSPTPGRANSSDGYSDLPRSDTVKFSITGGYFQGGISLQLSSENGSDSIFYTFDGSEPFSDDSLYTHPIFITKNCVIRARTLHPGMLPGVISTNTYITSHHTLPVVCISTNPENLWDYNTGIYVMGPNASATSPHFGANFWQDWEKKGHMEFYDLSGKKQIDQEIGIKIYGAFSRARPQKSLALFARKEYGKGSFDYRFFSDKPIEKYEALVLRNGGNDWGGAIMRDGLTSTLIRNMDIDRQAFQPAILYLNGEYWGILNLREKINPSYLAENHFVDPDDVNLLEKNAAVIDGSNSSYLQINSFLNSNTLETEANYSQVSSKIDINNYIQYQLTQIYINNQDWPANNIKFWNTNASGALWRWIIFDTDFGFNYKSTSDYLQNTLEFALATNGPNWPNPPWATLLFRRMMTNTEFRNEFASQYTDRLNSNFSGVRVSEVVDSIRLIYVPEISAHLTRWGLSSGNWENSIARIKNFALYRPDYARFHLKSLLGLSDEMVIRIDINVPGRGTVKINSITSQKFPFFGTYFRNQAIKLTAVPAPGYKFLRWDYGTQISGSATLDINMSSASVYTAVFIVAESTDIKIVVNEINYNASGEKNTEDWIELYNAGKTSVNLRNWIISDGGPASGFKITSDIILAPGMLTVICRDVTAFSSFIPEVKNITGNMNFGLSSSGDDINVYDPQGNLADFVKFSPGLPWPTDANGTGASIELVDPLADNNDGRNWRSRQNGGTPGTANLLTGINETDANLLSAFDLSCFPNPFRDYTTIRIEVNRPGRYRLEVLDLQGRSLRILEDKLFEPGEYLMDLGGNGFKKGLMQGGVYFVRMSGLNQMQNLKVIYIE
jgi:hypothetical protein